MAALPLGAVFSFFALLSPSEAQKSPVHVGISIERSKNASRMQREAHDFDNPSTGSASSVTDARPCGLQGAFLGAMASEEAAGEPWQDFLIHATNPASAGDEASTDAARRSIWTASAPAQAGEPHR